MTQTSMQSSSAVVWWRGPFDRIERTVKGHEIFNSYGYAGTKATLEGAIAEYQRMENGNSAYEQAHNY